jgi:glycosyltransferase involved in cell wall biosynthesis
LYASAPHRGLDQFLDIWPRVHPHLPEYSLHIAGHLNLYSESFKQTKVSQYERYKDVLSDLKQLPAVHIHDTLNREQYCQLMASSEALLYPCQTNEETSCITVHEAIALGCVPIVSSAGALSEVVLDGKTGRVVNGQPRSYLNHPDHPDALDFRNRFVETVIQTIQSRDIDRLRQHDNPNVFSWQHQAENLANQLSMLVNSYKEKSWFQKLRCFMAGMTG